MDREHRPPRKRIRFLKPDGFLVHPRASPQPRSRTVPNFHSDFALSDSTSSNVPHPVPSKQKQTSRTRARPVVDFEHSGPDHRPDTFRPLRALEVLVPNENLLALGSTRVLSPPPPPLTVLPSPITTKVLRPPRLSSPPPPRPSTPPKDLAAPDLLKFRSPSHAPPRPSKPVSETFIARATDLWTQGGRADVLGLTLEQNGVQHATPFEKAVRRGLEVSPRKFGVGKEIRYPKGGLAEQASQAIGKKATALTLWRRSAPSLESASMLVQIEEILDSTKRGGTGLLLCLTRCRARKQDHDASELILFSVPPHDAKDVSTTAFRVGVNVALWEPLDRMSRVYLCTRFVLLRE
ncbi:hypothetical protein BC827DRAFT_1208519 [Russula dissimulans]|nr:hypothetical protein BC827DRAFT_1208519 [Russula dissimulans]